MIIDSSAVLIIYRIFINMEVTVKTSMVILFGKDRLVFDVFEDIWQLITLILPVKFIGILVFKLFLFCFLSELSLDTVVGLLVFLILI